MLSPRPDPEPVAVAVLGALCSKPRPTSDGFVRHRAQAGDAAADGPRRAWPIDAGPPLAQIGLRSAPISEVDGREADNALGAPRLLAGGIARTAGDPQPTLKAKLTNVGSGLLGELDGAASEPVVQLTRGRQQLTFSGDGPSLLSRTIFRLWPRASRVTQSQLSCKQTALRYFTKPASDQSARTFRKG